MRITILASAIALGTIALCGCATEDSYPTRSYAAIPEKFARKHPNYVHDPSDDNATVQESFRKLLSDTAAEAPICPAPSNATEFQTWICASDVQQGTAATKSAHLASPLQPAFYVKGVIRYAVEQCTTATSIQNHTSVLANRIFLGSYTLSGLIADAAAIRSFSQSEASTGNAALAAALSTGITNVKGVLPAPTKVSPDEMTKAAEAYAVLTDLNVGSLDLRQCFNGARITNKGVCDAAILYLARVHDVALSNCGTVP